mmetsp:Transcript_82953/g.231402  ORF Transcript_82953/g.231402 Transcript_82953/m.231402 type:complete len:612 (+) Transcript_82953:147-1982(+)
MNLSAVFVATLSLVMAPFHVAGASVSARCSGSAGETHCTLVAGAASDADAMGTFHDAVEETGWGRLLVRTRSTKSPAPFAAGYVEGALTARRVIQHFANLKAGAKLDPLQAGVREFVLATDAWARKQIEVASPKDEYWNSVRFVYEQMDGLMAGVNDQLSLDERLSRLDVLLLNMQFDLDEIKTAVNVTERADIEKMRTEELSLWARGRSHCSSIVKLAPDGIELFIGHNSWMGFHMLLRVFKRYEFGGLRPVAMPSFPGVLSSTDDFYQVGDLVVTETTLVNFNNDLYAAVTPETLPFWIRAMVANQLATNGREWMEVFQRHNSGTYNNMWMAVDYSRFTPGLPLPEGVLTVGEQAPGHFYFEDVTEILAYGYWPSYNVAAFEKTARLIKQDVMADVHGNEYSHQLAPRAQIFRRDQGDIATDADMQRFMRYNQFQTDPLAKGEPCNQISCRADLDAGVKRAAFGAIDAKYTSSAHVRAGAMVIVAGPTHDDQPVFDWAAVPDLAARTSHLGQPSRFDFGWLLVGPGVTAQPFDFRSPTMAFNLRLTLVPLMFFAAVAGVAWRARRGTPDVIRTLCSGTWKRMGGVVDACEPSDALGHRAPLIPSPITGF